MAVKEIMGNIDFAVDRIIDKIQWMYDNEEDIDVGIIEDNVYEESIDINGYFNSHSDIELCKFCLIYAKKLNVEANTYDFSEIVNWIFFETVRSIIVDKVINHPKYKKIIKKLEILNM